MDGRTRLWEISHECGFKSPLAHSGWFSKEPPGQYRNSRSERSDREFCRSWDAWIRLEVLASDSMLCAANTAHGAGNNAFHATAYSSFADGTSVPLTRNRCVPCR
ncbi:hypothetical protein CTE05_34130 [Cellulomonas terrae]|uniref:Uncharacterized protein n=1 Tax=Cellulomonas terrae TaxID=311234 RepID=A0A511JPE2_9CELL|nr:hypothetical protein CTE05_34130 [Cellulomonas terrae]